MDLRAEIVTGTAAIGYSSEPGPFANPAPRHRSCPSPGGPRAYASETAVDSQGTVPPVLPSDDEAWLRIRRVAIERARHLTRGSQGIGDPEDLAHEALLRLLAAYRTGRRIDRPEAWLDGTLRHLILDRLRGQPHAGWSRSSVSDSNPANQQSGDDAWSDPQQAAMLRELWASAPRSFASMPAPHDHVAALRFLHGWERRRIVRFLLDWRPIGKEEAKRLIARTDALVRGMGDDRIPRVGTAGTRRRRKNPWLATQPPPLRDMSGC